MLKRAIAVTIFAALAAPIALAEMVAKTYPVKDFTEFVSGGNTKVEISQDGTEYLRIEADAEVMKRLKVDQTGKRVSVWAKHDGNFFKWFGNNNEPVHIVLRVKQLDYLEISGGAQATLGNLQGEKFQLNVSGAGNVNFAALDAKTLEMELSGAANVRISSMNSQAQSFDLSGASNIDIKSASNSQGLNVKASGASNFRGKKLTAKEAELGASGASHVQATVIDILTADASGASRVVYLRAKTSRI